MPYAIDKPEDLPDNVQELSVDEQQVWINVFDSTHAACLVDKKSVEESESSALAQANEAVKDGVKGIALDDVPETYTDEVERKTYRTAYNTFYTQCMKGAGDTGNKCSDGSHTAGQAAVRKKRKKKAAGDGFSDNAMVAFYLPEDIATQIVLGIPGAVPVNDLHLTLAYLGKTDDISEKQVEDIKRGVSLWAKHQVPVDVRINGIARFTKTNSEDMQPIVALLDSRHLVELQRSLESYIRYDGGFDYEAYHAFLPHVTLGYMPQGSLWPVQNLPELKFMLKTVILKIGEMRYDLELTGEMSETTDGSEMSYPMPVLKAGARNSRLDAADIQTIHDKAFTLGAKCVTMDENKALETSLALYGLPLNEKAVDLERQLYQVRQAWHAKFDPPQPEAPGYEMERMKYWVKAVFADYVIVENMADGNLYRYEYSMTDGQITFANPVQVEVEFIEVSARKHGQTHPVTIKTVWSCAVEGHEHATPEEAQSCISKTSLNTPAVRAEFVKSLYSQNSLKTIQKTADEITVANYMVLFGGRDLEGIASTRVNRNGTLGEFFTKNTNFDSDYTLTGQLLIDWEHRTTPDPGGPDAEDVFGYVDWKSAVIDEAGLFVNRVLNRRNKYVQMLEALLDAGMIGSSSEPVQKGVIKGEDGEIKEWPMKRDSFSVWPMDPRMLSVNHLELVKALRDDPDGVVVYEAVFNAEVAVAQAAALSLISQIGATCQSR